MTKLNLILTSLVAAIPAGLLAYLIVAVFLTFGLPGTMLTVLAGGTLAVAVIVAVLPVGIAIFQPREVVVAAPAGSDVAFDPDARDYEDLDSAGASGEFDQEDLSVFDDAGSEYGDVGTSAEDDDFDFEEFLEDDKR